MWPIYRCKSGVWSGRMVAAAVWERRQGWLPIPEAPRSWITSLSPCKVGGKGLERMVTRHLRGRTRLLVRLCGLTRRGSGFVTRRWRVCGRGLRKWQGICESSPALGAVHRGRVEWRTSDCPAVTVPLGDVLQSGPDVYVVPRILVGRV